MTQARRPTRASRHANRGVPAWSGIGTALDNQALTADAAESAFCAFTAGAALLGVGLNAWLGWWWADPAAALVIAALAVREGREVLEGD